MLDPQWFYSSCEYYNKTGESEEVNTLTLTGRETKLELKSDKWLRIYKLKKVLKRSTVQQNFSTEFERTKQVKKLFKKESFLARRFEDNQIFFCRRYEITNPNKQNKLNDVHKILKLNYRLRKYDKFNCFEYIYEDPTSITVVYRYFDNSLVRDAPSRYTNPELCRIILALIKLVKILKDEGLVLIKFEPMDFRLIYDDIDLVKNRLILTNLNSIVEIDNLTDVYRTCKSKLHLAPELHIQQFQQIDCSAVSVFGIGQLLFQILSAVNLKLMKLRNVQEVKYMNSYNFKNLNSIGIDPISKLISHAAHTGHGAAGPKTATNL